MIRISRDQRTQLEKRFGFKVGREMHRTYSRPKSYYLIESPKCLQALDKIKNGK